MRISGKVIPWVALATIAGAVGCGGNNANGGSGGTSGNLAVDGAVPQATSCRYQPMAVGAAWVYNVTDTGIAFTKNSQVISYEDIGGVAAGIMGYKISETLKTKTQLTWYEMTDTDVRRHHDQKLDSNEKLTSEDWYTPYDLRVDESPDHLMAGAAWTMSYVDAHTSSKKPTSNPTIIEDWTTDAVNETVTVPAGTFRALKITRTNTADGTARSMWFVPGVGKIRESNTTGQVEELTSYTVPSMNGGG